MKFLPLFDLKLTHTYYTNGQCPDFRIEPSLETRQLLKNHRCILKTTPGGIRVLSAVSAASKAFIPLKQDAKFTFSLYLHNSNFVLFTDLVAISQPPAPLFTNINLDFEKSVQLALTSRQSWSKEYLAVNQPNSEHKYILSGRPIAGISLSDFTLTGLDNAASPNPSHYDETTKVITVNSQGANQGDPFMIEYESTAHKMRGAFAEIEIHNNATLPNIADGPAKFQISFKAKQTRWRYYIIVDKNGNPFQIKDQGATPLKFSQDNQTILNDHPDPSDEIAVMLAEKYADLKRLRFISDELIPCQQKARNSIQLHLEGNKLMDALLNPPLRNTTSINAGQNGGSDKEDAVYQIIKYFTQNNQLAGGN
jgi:hypothetical protein